MFKNIFSSALIFLFAVFLVGCGNTSLYKTQLVTASSGERAAALKLNPKPDMATLYLYRPSLFSNSAQTSSFRINDKRLGEFHSGFFVVDLVPGTHELRAFMPTLGEEYHYERQTVYYTPSPLMQIDAKAGELIFIEYHGHRDTLKTVSANTAKPELNILPYYVGGFETMTERKITAEDAAWDACNTALTVSPCQTLLASYPNSRFKPEALQKIASFEAAEAAAIEKKKNDRDSALPIGVRHDKYMVALTSHLKNQNYQQALPYFKRLEALNVELASSFNYFYGETLLRLGQPANAIEKLYAYITVEGSSGTYYTKALELVNEAEALER
jgi:hypothetical protein